MIKKLAFFFILIFTITFTFAQGSIDMGTQSTISGCDLYIYDNGGAGGNYSTIADNVLTIYSNDPNNGCVMIEIQSLDIDPSDTLFIYDGTSINDTLLHWFNNTNYDSLGTFRYAATIQNSTGALTLRFLSDASGTGAGYQIHATCMAPCQRVIVKLDSLNSSHIPQRDPDDGYYYIDLCPNDSVHIVTYCDYPDNRFSYLQRDEATTFQWNLDIAEYDTLGGNTLDYVFTSGRGYSVSISATDSAQCPSLTPVTFRVRTSQNPFLNISPLPPICSNDELDLNVGYDSLSIVQLAPIGSAQVASLCVTDTVFLPDGIYCAPNGYYYRSYVNFTTFAPNATITSANDILYVRIKMEHSAIEDIRITLVCPNNSSCKIVPDYQNDGWGSTPHSYFRTNLGLANRAREVVTCDSTQNPIGTPWNYVWSNNTTLGYQYAAGSYGYCFEPVNIQSQYNPNWDSGSYSYCIDSSDVANMTQIYHPYQDFSRMVNCPLNGNWYIQVEDLWSNDNGYIVEWEMALDPNLLPQNWSYDVAVDTTYLTGPGASGLHIAPDESGDLTYNAVLLDEFGCRYDTVFPLTVVQNPEPNMGDDQNICIGETATLNANYNAENTTFLWNTGETSDNITVDTSGTFTVLVSTSTPDGVLTCSNSDTAIVLLNPDPHANFSLSDSTACGQLEFYCYDETTPAGLDLSYTWYILDETNSTVETSNLATPQFTLNIPGNYSVKLVVMTSDG